MNIRHVVILAIFLLAITCVSAADNATGDNLTSPSEIEVNFDEQMWEENLSDIEVNLPEDTEGDFAVKINDEVIYNQTIVNKSFKVPIKLPKKDFIITANIWPPFDCDNYKVNSFLNGVEISSKTLKVMKYSPDFNYFNHFPNEILQHDEQNTLRFSLMLPRSSNGDIELYLDDRLLTKTKVNPPFLDIDYTQFTNLDLGSHRLKIIYENDTYYHPVNITHVFEVTRAVITIPNPINIGHDDCLSVKTNAPSTVNVYIDSQLIASKTTEFNEFILSLEEYLKRDSKEVTVVVSNSEFTRQKTQKINVTYDFDVYVFNSYVYGEDNVLEFYLPDTLNNDLLTIQIDGVRYPFTHPSYIVNNIIEVDISNLNAGNHSLFISYPGDGRFNPHTKTLNFTVNYAIIYPYMVEYGDGSSVYINLPKDARGYLEVYINKALFKSAKMSNGHAEIRLDSLTPGEYALDVRYCGGDYDIEGVSLQITVDPKITIDGCFTVGEQKSITLEVPKNCRGVMIVEINSKKYKIQIKNGKAVLSLKSLKIGEYDINVTYIGENGYKTSQYFYIEVDPAKIKIRAKNINILYKHKAKYSVKLFGRDAKALKNVWVKFKIGKKTYKAKTNRYGIATIKLPKLKVKTHKIIISYKNIKITKKIRVTLLKLSKVKKSKSKLKLKATLYKKLKGKTVTFKFLGKKYKAKTNSKGTAHVVVKVPKTAKKLTFSGTYMKNTVKQSI